MKTSNEDLQGRDGPGSKAWLVGASSVIFVVPNAGSDAVNRGSVARGKCETASCEAGSPEIDSKLSKFVLFLT